MLAAGGVVVLVAGVFDIFDGAVARMTNRATKFGALFDSVMDRVSEAVVLLGLLWFYLEDGEQLGASPGVRFHRRVYDGELRARSRRGAWHRV